MDDDGLGGRRLVGRRIPMSGEPADYDQAADPAGQGEATVSGSHV